MKTTTRRTVLTGGAALPLLPVSAYASANATDAAWAVYGAAQARYAEHRSLYDAYEAALPIDPFPRFCDFEDRDEWGRRRVAWERERAQYPDNPFALDDDAFDVLIDAMNAPEDEIIATPATTLTDVERKLLILVERNSGGSMSEVASDRPPGLSVG